MRCFSVLLISLFLPACVDINTDDLAKFVGDAKDQHHPITEKVPELINSPPLIFSQQQARDPFQKPNVRTGVIESEKVLEDCLVPDVNREKESLESFFLADLEMRGTLKINQELYAIIGAPNGFFYKVKSGNYLGLNNGKIIKVSEKAINLFELKVGRNKCWETQKTEIKLSLK